MEKDDTIPGSVGFEVIPADKEQRKIIIGLITRFRFITQVGAGICYQASMVGSKLEQDEEGWLHVKGTEEHTFHILDILFGEARKQRQRPDLLVEKEGQKLDISKLFKQYVENDTTLSDQDKTEYLRHITTKLDWTPTAPFYHLRRWVQQELDGWYAKYVDEVRRKIESWWKAKDPRVGINQGYMLKSGGRRPPLFNFIPIPIPAEYVQIENNTFTVKIGSNISFKLIALGKRNKQDRKRRLDPSRRNALYTIRENRWHLGTCFLTIRDGKLNFRICYYSPVRDNKLDQKRIMEVSFRDDPTQFLSTQIAATSINGVVDEVYEKTQSCTGVIDRLGQYKAQMLGLKGKLSSCGSKFMRRTGGGSRKGYEHFSKRMQNVSSARENFVKQQNHIWTNWLVSRAKELACGAVKIYDIPSLSMADRKRLKQLRDSILKNTAEDVAAVRAEIEQLEQGVGLFGHSWAWANFEEVAGYKFKRDGITIEMVESPVSPSEVVAKFRETTNV